MLTLPKSLRIVRSEKQEQKLVEQTRAWLKNDHRDPRIHASDLLDPRKAYWDRQHPVEPSTRMVGHFFVGKVLQAFFLSALNGEKGVNWASDAGSVWDKDLGIMWSNDWEDKSKDPHIPWEFKTSRKPKEMNVDRDLDLYCEQLLIYMVAQGSTTGRLVVLQPNLTAPRGEGWGSYPQYRAYTVSVTPADLELYKKQILRTRKALEVALKTKKPKELPLCREFKCGAANCPHYQLCKPEGRYGKRSWDRT